MPVTTQTTHSLNHAKLDDRFTKQLESMLGGVSASRVTKQTVVEREVQAGQVSLDEVLPQANDGISLAQVIDATLQQAGEQLAQVYYTIESAAQNSHTNFIELNNLARQQLDEVAELFAKTSFQDQAVFQSTNPIANARKIPTGLNQDDYLTLQIPNTAMNQLGSNSWQLADGPVMPSRLGDKLVFNCNNLRLQQGQRIHLTLGDADILEECVIDVKTTLQVISDLINEAELEWLNQATVTHEQFSVVSRTVENGSLIVESQAVAVNDSLAALQVNDSDSAQKAMNSIVGAINMLADYREITVSVANDLHSAVNDLLNAPLQQAQDMNAPLASAMVKDVQKMFEQCPAQAVVAQANTQV